MNFLPSLLVWFYSALLSLYPQEFRNEFAEEMQTVFRDSVYERSREGIFPLAILSFREFGGLPFNILKEFWREFQGKELVMLNENGSNSPITTGQVVGGTLPFLLFGILLIVQELPMSFVDQIGLLPLMLIVFVSLLILPAIGFGMGWVQSFPLWSYPYTGMALIMALYIQNVSTPGLNFFGIPIFGRELWGWRAWVPLAITFTIALAVSRSLKPFTSFFINLWNDWTIPSYLMVGALPLLVMFAFDEIDQMYSLYFMLVIAVMLVGMIVLYLRRQTAWQRVLVLTIGVLAIIYPAALGSNSYWLAHHGTDMTNVDVAVEAGKIAIIMLIPAWLELLRRAVRHLRIA